MDGVVSDWRDRVRSLSLSLEEGMVDLEGLCDNVKEASAAMNYGEHQRPEVVHLVATLYSPSYRFQNNSASLTLNQFVPRASRQS